MSDYQFTKKVESIFTDSMDTIKPDYSREVFEEALNAYNSAKEDNEIFLKKKLRELCEKRNINVEELIKDNNILNSIPTEDKINEEMLKFFYELCMDAPTTEKYMERIVRRLAPEYNSDSLRVAILKKFVSGAEMDCKSLPISKILKIVENRLDDEGKKKVNELEEEDKKIFLTDKIDDSIFDEMNCDLTSRDIIDLILKFKNIHSKKDPEIGNFDDNAQKVIDRVSGTAESANDNLDEVKNVEEKFRKTLTNDLKTKYTQAKKDLKDTIRDQRGVALLVMCDDLAKGKFKINGKTKVNIYYFGIMFGMKVYSQKDKDYNVNNDFVKNMFEDYYNDNLKRLLTEDYKVPNAPLEKEPTGEGINYKNYVESVYLYFLCRDDLSMSPGKKIDTAEWIIDRCVKLARKKANDNIKNGLEFTMQYKEELFSELVKKDTKELEEFIVTNYQILQTEPNETARIMVASKENTAFDRISLLNVWIPKRYDNNEEVVDSKLMGLLVKHYGTDKKFIEIVDLLHDRVCKKTDDYDKEKLLLVLNALHFLESTKADDKSSKAENILFKAEDIKKWIVNNKNNNITVPEVKTLLDNLREIGFNINTTQNGYSFTYEKGPLEDLWNKTSGLYYDPQISGVVVEESIELIEELMSENLYKKRFTRTEFIVLYYNYYLSNLVDTKSDGTYLEIFNDFMDYINGELTELRYQPLSKNNIFDMYVLMALYFHVFDYYKSRS